MFLRIEEQGLLTEACRLEIADIFAGKQFVEDFPQHSEDEPYFESAWMYLQVLLAFGLSSQTTYLFPQKIQAQVPSLPLTWYSWPLKV